MLSRFTKKISPQKYRNFILFPLMAILLCIFTALLVTTRESKAIAYNEVKNTLNQQRELLNSEIRSINYETTSMISRELYNLQKLKGVQVTDASYYNYLNNISSELSAFKVRHSMITVAYLYLPNEDVIVLNDGIVFPISDVQNRTQGLVNLLHTIDLNMDNSIQWHMMEADQTYLCSTYIEGDYVSGVIIRADNFFNYLKSDTVEYDMIPFIRQDDQFYASSADIGRLMDSGIDTVTWKEMNSSGSSDFLHFYLIAIRSNVYIFLLRQHGLISRIEILIIVTIVLTVIALGAVLLFLQFYSHEILAPMSQFVKSLENMDEDQYLYNREGNNLLALEMANKEFSKLFRQIQSLRINIYEKELEREKIELQATQLQIRPHFYINCLNLIHGFAEDAHQYEIVEITQKLAEYMRTLLDTNSDLVSIKRELNLIQNYVDIQHLHYGQEAFSIDIQAEDNVLEKKIPFLILYNFVENSIWHNIAPEKCVNISLYIVSEKIDGQSYIYIALSDNGKGFSPEVLEAAANRQVIMVNGESHVGIYTSIKRLEYFYGNMASISLSNMAEGYGAIVEIRIPERQES